VGQGATQPEQEPGKNIAFAKIAKYLAIGVEFTSSIFGSLVLGYLIDLKLNTSPWFSIAAAVLGFAGAVWRLMRNLRRFGDDAA
jgi:F0F1-type ATP synthase assembly protein I